MFLLGAARDSNKIVGTFAFHKLEKQVFYSDIQEEEHILK